MAARTTGTDARRGLWRSRWAAIGAAVAVTLGGGGLFVANAASGPASSVVTVTPDRVLDTRTGVGLSGPFLSGVSRKLQITGAVVPAGATGVLLNVTVVAPSAAGFLSVRPGDATGVPSTSSLNFVAGDIVPNSVQVALPIVGVNAGQIDITFDAFGAVGPTTNVLADVVGYLFAGGSSTPGATGPAGAVGPAGAPGPAGPVNLRWAKVAASSTAVTLLSSSGAVSAARQFPGVYQVRFNGSIVGCGWTATLNDNDAGSSSPGEISVERASPSNLTDLFIRTYTSVGFLADTLSGDGFTVMVICP